MKNWLNQYTLKIKLNKIPDLRLEEYLEGIRKSLELEDVESKIVSENKIYFNDAAPWYKKSRGATTIGIKGYLTIIRDGEHIRITYDHDFISSYIIFLIISALFCFLINPSPIFFTVLVCLASLQLCWQFFAFNSILIGGIHHHT